MNERLLADMICKDDQIIKLSRQVAELQAVCNKLRNKLAYVRSREKIVPNPDMFKRTAAIASAVCAERGISDGALMARTQAREISHARQEVMYLASIAGISGRQIAAFFGLDNSTVVYGIRAEKARRTDQAKALQNRKDVAELERGETMLATPSAPNRNLIMRGSRNG
jgi:chromosomal replication initiation ATPase DnaA